MSFSPRIMPMIVDTQINAAATVETYATVDICLKKSIGTFSAEITAPAIDCSKTKEGALLFTTLINISMKLIGHTPKITAITTRSITKIV